MNSSYPVVAILAFSLGSMAYVYKFRGNARFHNLTEYLRKGWPIFAPLNCVLYLFTRKYGRSSVLDICQYPELSVLEENWGVIRDEGLALLEQGYFDLLGQPGSVAYYDVGFRTFFKYGWRKFYLKWYGYDHESARKLCPKTQDILKSIPCINGALFSLLPPDSQLTRHLDPFACSLRYHLGLATPNSELCFISVDGRICFWRDGEPLLFDSTCIHFARNNSEQSRLILMCDIERPMNVFGRTFNSIYKLFMRQSIVPNTDEDKGGLANRLFRKLEPLLLHGKALKVSRPRVYRVIKFAINLVLILALLSIVWGAVQLVMTVLLY